MTNFTRLITKEKVWHRKALLIDIFHTTNSMADDHWTLRNTANELHLSIGQVSEDLRLAVLIRADESLTLLSRNLALRKLKKT